ncbi:MAG: aminotransferase class I/II-fold pyridoxal phosphate-dependent enzyme [Pseudomonadota bacterium]|jgi:UDP-2-acetamido-2-deoxy-ribo-hexuluronate aminotransferase
MRHLVFDVNVLLDAFLCRGESGQAEKLLERVAEGKIKGWIAAQSLAVLEYVLRRILKEDGASGEEAQTIAQDFMGWVRQHLSVLTLPGEESRLACGGDLEDVQIALAARALGDEACIVTNDKKFSVIDGVHKLTVEDACKSLNEMSPERPIEFIDLKEQQRRVLPRLEQNIRKVLHHGQYIMGPEVRELEEKLAAYTGARHCITVASGTEALLISLMALGVKPGDEVITTPFTFVATAEVIALLGATPVFVDIQPDTCNIDPSLIEAAITPKTRAIMPVSLYGQPADMDEINAIAARHGNIPVIEDAAQSFGATYKGKKSCNLSTIGCTSFFPSKPLGCYGDGGAIFTSDDALVKAMREIRVHGQEKRYYHTRVGVGGRMDTLQCAVVLAKLERFDLEVEQRIQAGERYLALLSGAPSVRQLAVRPDRTCVWGQFTVQVENRETVLENLKAAGIPTAVHYPVPLHRQPAYQTSCRISSSLENADGVAARVVSLPMHPELDEAVQRRVVDVLLGTIN